MVNDKKNSGILILLYLFAALFLFSGCYSVEERKDATEQYEGQFTLFLNGPQKSSLDITFDLLAVSMISEDGIPMDILDAPLKINSMTAEGRQILLGESQVPEGKYITLRFVIRKPLIRKKERLASLALPAEGVEIPLDVIVSRQRNVSIFVNWNADASVADGYLFKPAFAARSQSPELSTLLIYVTNEDSNNVSVINKQTGAVVATIMVGERPRGIATVMKGERSRIYVANSGSDSISVIDPTTNMVENEIPIKFGKKPEGIAAASVSSGKELVFVANYDTNSVSVIDSTTFQETEKIDVGQGPIAVAVDPSIDSLLGTRHLTVEDTSILKRYREKFFNVYVVNKNSNDVSVIRIDKTTNRSVEVTSLPVEWKPVALTVDYKRGKVYVVNYGSDRLSVIDIVKVYKGLGSLAVSTINNVGNFIRGVVADPGFDRIYLLKEMPGEIMIIRPFPDSFDSFKSIMPPVMGVIPVGDFPRSFVLGPEHRKLYVVNRGANTISVVDKTTRKEEQVIHVGRKPYGIAIFQD